MTMKIEHRYIDQRRAKTRLETRQEGEQPKVQGYAAVYFNSADADNTQYPMWDGYVERIMPGAFEEALRSDDVRCLFNHDPNMVLGRSTSNTLHLSSDNVGLFYSCDCPQTTVGRDVSELLGRGDVSGSSFGFEILQSEYEEDQGGIWYRNIVKVRLYDVGPVTFPAYSGSTSEIAKRSLQAAQQKRQCHTQEQREALRNRRNLRIRLFQARHRPKSR